jgi:hypothetical protein
MMRDVLIIIFVGFFVLISFHADASELAFKCVDPENKTTLNIDYSKKNVNSMYIDDFEFTYKSESTDGDVNVVQYENFLSVVKFTYVLNESGVESVDVVVYSKIPGNTFKSGACVL